MMLQFTFFIALLCNVCNISIKQLSDFETIIFVSTSGDDNASGEINAPLKSIGKAISLLKNGGTIYLRAGSYFETLSLKNHKNSELITVKAYANEDVIFDGTSTIKSEWTLWKNGIYKTNPEVKVWQLFNDYEYAEPARWPDAHFEDGSIWRMTESMRKVDGGRRRGTYYGKSRFGIVYDTNFTNSNSKSFHEGDSRYEVTKQTTSLAASGKNFKGAYAVLNIGNWLTWAREIETHEAGSDHFTYNKAGITEKELNSFGAYYIYGLEALDQPNEWWYNKDSNTLYYYPPKNLNPNKLKLQSKQKDFTIDLLKCQNITFEGLNFFATGFNIQQSHHISFKDCKFEYPSTNKFVLGEFDWFHGINKSNQKVSSIQGGKDNAFINCEFWRSNAPIYLISENILVDNCEFESIEWDVNSNGGSGSLITGEGGTIRRSNFSLCGNSEGIRPARVANTIQLNRLWDMGNLQHDGAAINIGTQKQKGTIVEQNWVHDSNRQGLRFDYHGNNVFQEDGTVYGDAIYRNNVSWNTQPNQVKGDRHLILNNTIVNSNTFGNSKDELFNMSIQGFKAMHEIMGNEHSITRNNLANLAHRSWALKGKTRKRADGYELPTAKTIPGTHDHNISEPMAAIKYLKAPLFLDFRPKNDSPLIDAGIITTGKEVPSKHYTYRPFKYNGKAPDIGAYEYDEKQYWIPGRQYKTASTPIPPDGSKKVSINSDLMFLEAINTDTHHVYYGTTINGLKKLKTLKSSNIANPKLKPNQIYYWRVDAVHGKTTIEGPVWSFKTQ